MYKVGLQSPKIKKQKNIENETLVPNLSQLYIQIPKPQFSNKISSVHQTQLSELLSSQHHYYSIDDQSHKISENLVFSNKADSNELIFSNTKTKNSSSSASKNYRSESQIIKEWVKNLFTKKNLLGLHWEQKLRKKKRLWLKEAFQCIKEENKSQSIYLQTQSKHKSLFKKEHHLVQLALESFRVLNNNISLKMKRQAFSMILRHLIFMPHNTKTGLQQSRIIYQTISPPAPSKTSKSIRLIHSNNINIKIQFPVKQVKYNEKVRYNTNEQILKEQIKKSIFLVENQYALNPLSPTQKFKSEKVNNRNEHHEMKKSTLQQINIFSDNKQTNIPIRNSPNPHNKLLEFDSNNGPQTPKKLVQNYICAPLTPKRVIFHHQQPNNIAFNPVNHYQPLNHYKEINKSQNHKDPQYKRPATYSPIANLLHQPIINDSFQADNLINNNVNGIKKSRSVSFSTKIKLDSLNTNPRNAINFPENHPANINNDYQDINAANILKIGSCQRLLGGLQNRKVRQSYQKNSKNHELVQDNKIMAQPFEPYVKSNPISPRYHEIFNNKLNQQQFNNKLTQQQYYYIKSQDHVNQNSPRSAHNIFGRHSFMPIQKQSETQQINHLNMRNSLQMSPNGQNNGKKISKDKLAVTQKIRYN